MGAGAARGLGVGQSAGGAGNLPVAQLALMMQFNCPCCNALLGGHCAVPMRMRL